MKSRSTRSKLCIWVVLLFLFTLPSKAQINEGDTLGFKANLSLGGFLQKGNVEAFSLRSKFDLGKGIFPGVFLKSQNSYLYQSFFGFKADEDIYSRNFLYLKPNARSYPYLISFIASSYRREIQLRHFTGLGYTFVLYNSPSFNLKISGNIVFEESRFRESAFNESRFDGNTSIKTWRGTTYVETEWVLNALSVHGSWWIMPSLDGASLLRYQGEAMVKWRLGRGFSASATLLYTREGLIVLGNETHDLVTTYGLIYEL